MLKKMIRKYVLKLLYACVWAMYIAQYVHVLS